MDKQNTEGKGEETRSGRAHGYASDWHRRKAERSSRYLQQHGCKLVTCTACNGSGYYDARNSPKCDCCGGTGRCRERHNDKLTDEPASANKTKKGN